MASRPSKNGTPGQGYWGILLIVLGAVLGWLGMQPPEALDEQASTSEFSAARAMGHVEALAASSREMGSPGHARAERYLLETTQALGLESTVQHTTIAFEERGLHRVANVRNIIARWPGRDASGAVVLAAHYDSAPNSPGAADNAASVAALLESGRALASGGALARDVLLLFVDGEEAGLVGARAFVDQHPWGRSISAVVNFEARGSQGASFLFETSPGNHRLVRALAQAAPHPMANSYAYEVYRRMPNETDFSVFRDAGLNGLNFAFFGHPGTYHTSQDVVSRLSSASLQHQGDYALSLARVLGAAGDEMFMPAGDAIYFPVPWGLLTVSAFWALPAVLLLGVLVVMAIRRRPWSWRSVVGGGVAILGAAMAAILAVVVFHRLAVAMLGDWRMVRWQELDAFLIAASLVAAASTLSVWRGLSRWRGAAASPVGALAIWWLLALLLSIVAAGASYLLMVPAFFIAGSMAMARPGARLGGWSAVVAGLGACALGYIWFPLFLLLATALGAGGQMVLAVLMTLFLAMAIAVVGSRLLIEGWAVAALWIAAAVVGAVAVAGAGYDAEHPQADSLVYTLDVDRSAAHWLSFDSGPNAWTGQFVTTTERQDMSDFLGLPWFEGLAAPAPVMPWPGPRLEALAVDPPTPGRYRARIQASRPAHSMWLQVSGDAPITSLDVGGQPLNLERETPSGSSPLVHRVLYRAPPAEGFELTIETEPGSAVRVVMVSEIAGLPPKADGSTPARPPDLRPTIWLPSDVSFLRRVVELSDPLESPGQPEPPAQREPV